MLPKLLLRSPAKSSSEDSSDTVQERSPMYVSGVGAEDADKVEAAAASSGAFICPFPAFCCLGPCPSMLPPLAKQCAASCDFLPQTVHRTPSGFFSCLWITDPARLQYSEPAPDFL